MERTKPKPDDCAECERVQNLPPYERLRACEDHEDGEGRLGANHE